MIVFCSFLVVHVAGGIHMHFHGDVHVMYTCFRERLMLKAYCLEAKVQYLLLPLSWCFVKMRQFTSVIGWCGFRLKLS